MNSLRTMVHVSELEYSLKFYGDRLDLYLRLELDAPHERLTPVDRREPGNNGVQIEITYN